MKITEKIKKIDWLNLILLFTTSFFTTLFLEKYYNLFADMNKFDTLVGFIECFLLFLLFINQFLKNKDNKILYAILNCAMMFFIFMGNKPLIEIDNISKIVMIIATIIVSLKSMRLSFANKWHFLGFIMLTIINSFLFVGYPVFLSENHFNPQFIRVYQFVLCCLWLIPFENMLINLLANYKLKERNYNDKKVFFLVFAIVFCIWVIAAIAFYPTNIASDGVDQVLQALKINKLEDAHPAIMAIIIRIIFHFSYSTFSVTIVQIFLFSLLISVILSYFFKKGFKLNTIIILAIIFAIIPNNLSNATSIVKDVPFTIFLIYICYDILKIIIDENDFFSKWYNYILLPLSLVLCCLYRHNGPGPFVFTIIFLIVCSIKSKNYKPSLIIVASLALLLIVKGPVYKFSGLKVEKNATTQKVSMFAFLVNRSSASILINGGTIDDNVKEIVERSISIELLKKYFDKFNGDTYGWNKEVDDYFDSLEEVKDISNMDFLKSYMNNFYHHPYQVMKERADATNIVWTVAMPVDSYNHRYLDGIWYPAKYTEAPKLDIFKVNGNKNQPYFATNKVANAIRESRNYITDIAIGDWIFWRVGLSWMIILTSMFYLLLNNKQGLLITLPIIATTLTFLSTLVGSIYRYVWYIFVFAFFFPWMAIIVNNCKIKQKEK